MTDEQWAWVQRVAGMSGNYFASEALLLCVTELQERRATSDVDPDAQVASAS